MLTKRSQRMFWIIVSLIFLALFALKLTSFEILSRYESHGKSNVEYNFIHSDVSEVEIVNAKGRVVKFTIEPEARGKLTMEMLERMAENDTSYESKNIHIWNAGGLEQHLD